MAQTDPLSAVPFCLLRTTPYEQELIYVESHLSNIGTKFYGELTQNILKQADSPGSNNGTGFLQTLVALKLREVYERITKKTVSVKLPESVAQ